MLKRGILSVVIWLAAILLQPWTNLLAQVYHVQEMNVEQIRALDREKTVVLLPGGILEEHGPYLPSFSDGYMNERLKRDLADAIVARPGWQVLIFPLIPLGTDGANYIGGKQTFPGSYTVRSATLRAVFMDLATVLGEQGFRWILVIHLHGAPNHHRALDQAGDYFHDLFGGQMVNLCGLAMRSLRDAESELVTEKERDEDGLSLHAGLSETSRILFLRPDLVSPAYKDALPYAGDNMDELIQIAEKKDWPGYFGSPRLANAAFGARVWDQLSDSVTSLALSILDGKDYRQTGRWGDVAETLPAWAAIDKAALEHEHATESKQLEWLRRKGLK